ncbi:MAG: DNA primase [Alphaproteobacteria bacterium]
MNSPTAAFGQPSGFGRFDDALLEQLRRRVPLVEEVRKAVPALKKKGKFWWGCCPFHQEKSPSFHVRPDDGHYHCFGCGAHGDVITFAMETKGLSFPDAVEALANQAGMALPQVKSDPAAEKARHDGLQALARAQVYYSKGIGSGAVAEYVRKRELSADTVATFGLGYAPDAWEDTRLALMAENFTLETLRAAGLSIYNEDRKSDYDRFRGRLMFPIHDLKDRIIAFGGRVIGQGEPKYLNSPDTPFFSKTHTLYNLNRAKEHIRSTSQALLVEGYMDVIALWQAGIQTAVAPMGTAVTAEQLQLLWQHNNAPIVCLDGDNAGRNAAIRAAKRALPVLRPGKTLTFVYLPQGEDPDSLVRNQGVEALQKILARPLSLEEILWQDATAGLDMATADGRTQADSNIKAMMAEMGDETIRRHYGQALRDKLWQARGGSAKPQARTSWVPMVEGDQGVRLVLGVACAKPQVVGFFETEFADISVEEQKLKQIHTLLLRGMCEKGLAEGEMAPYLEKSGVQATVLGLLAHPLVKEVLDSTQAEAEANGAEAAERLLRAMFRTVVEKALAQQRSRQQHAAMLGSVKAGLNQPEGTVEAEDAFGRLREIRERRAQALK